MRPVAALAALVVLATAAEAVDKLKFPAFKDDLFKYPAVVSTSPDGSLETVEFSRERDVYGRDAVPEKTAKPDRVDLAVNSKKQDLVLTDGSTKVPFVEIGDISKPAKLAFIFIHGRNGNRFQGVDDGTFGGNFNRLKNLVVKTGGVYLSPGFRDQSSAGLAEAKVVINEFAKVSPNAPVFVACASNGGRICLRLLEDAGIAARLGGVFLLGSTYSSDFASSSAAKTRRVPIFMGHGGSDEVIFWRSPDSFYRSLRAHVPDYPVRFVTFKNGKHGTPMRMIDWRLELNRMVGAPTK